MNLLVISQLSWPLGRMSIFFTINDREGVGKIADPLTVGAELDKKILVRSFSSFAINNKTILLASPLSEPICRVVCAFADGINQAVCRQR